MKKYTYEEENLFIIGGIIACGALAYPLFSLFNNRAPYACDRKCNFVDKENSYIGKQMRVEGYVGQDTIDWTSPDYNLKFILYNALPTQQTTDGLLHRGKAGSQ